MTLEAIAAGKMTDKLSHHSYLPVYERWLSSLRDRKEPVLEVGAWYGGSLLMWSQYFSQATIYGCEVNHVPLPPEADPRIRIIQTDAYSPYAGSFLAALAPFSVLIDDGPHTLDSQVTFCRAFPPMLAPAGLAFVEDVQSPEHFHLLIEALPTGYDSAAIDLRHTKGRSDDLLLAVWKRA